MEYAATTQTFGQAQFNLSGLAGVRARAEKNIERLVQGLVLAILVAVPFFQGGMFAGESIIRSIGHLSYIQESAAHLGAAYAVTAIPVVLYFGAKKSTAATLACSAVISSIMGTLFYLSLC